MMYWKSQTLPLAAILVEAVREKSHGQKEHRHHWWCLCLRRIVCREQESRVCDPTSLLGQAGLLQCATLLLHASVLLNDGLAQKSPAGPAPSLWGGRVRYGRARFFDGEGLSRLPSSTICGTAAEAPGVPRVVGGVVARRSVRVCTCSGRVWSAVSTGTNR